VAAREYRSGDIAVLWQSSLCIHTGRCLRSLPAVFDTTRRPWIDVEAADADAIASAVERCPTGALRYERLDGGPQEHPERPTTVETRPGGPLFVRGEVRIVDPEGSVIDAGPRFALCRCGATTNPPFCDNHHLHIGWQSRDRRESGRRADAECPSDVEPGATEGPGAGAGDHQADTPPSGQ
jgi:uncharacterized Fe-S cluster protein YjdI/CDGSH-type Zn-finger protein